MRGIDGIAASEGEAANSGLMLVRLWYRQLEGHQPRRVPCRGVRVCGRHCPEAATEKSSSRNFTGQKSEQSSYPYHAAASTIRLIERCFAALFPQLDSAGATLGGEALSALLFSNLSTVFQASTYGSVRRRH